MTDQKPLAPLSYDQVRGWLAMEGALTGPLSWGLINAFRRAVQWDRDQRQAANEAKLQEARGAVPMTNQRPRAQVHIEGTELMRKWLRISDEYHLDLSPSGHDLLRSPAELMDALKEAAQWGYDQGQAERAAAMASLRKSATVTEAQLQEARDQQLDECCKWLEEKPGVVPRAWADKLRDAFRPKIDDSEAADAARMRWLLKGHGYPTYLAISEVTAWLRENDSTWNVGGDAAVNAARREIDKRMARDGQVVR